MESIKRKYQNCQDEDCEIYIGFPCLDVESEVKLVDLKRPKVEDFDNYVKLSDLLSEPLNFTLGQIYYHGLVTENLIHPKTDLKNILLKFNWMPETFKIQIPINKKIQFPPGCPLKATILGLRTKIKKIPLATQLLFETSTSNHQYPFSFETSGHSQQHYSSETSARHHRHSSFETSTPNPQNYQFTL